MKIRKLEKSNNTFGNNTLSCNTFRESDKVLEPNLFILHSMIKLDKSTIATRWALFTSVNPYDSSYTTHYGRLDSFLTY